MARYQQWSAEENAVLLEHAEQRGPQFCHQLLLTLGYNRQHRAVAQHCLKLGIQYKGPPIGRFRKGQQPHNKGQKMPADTYEKCSATMFKKGQIAGAAARKLCPVGAEHFNASMQYWTVKTGPKKWAAKHRLLWEQHHGPIPPGHVVIFRDGNPHNITLENLEMLTRAQLATRNRWGSGPSTYSLIAGRAATVRLVKKGISKKVIRRNPELIQITNAEIILNLKMRKRNDIKR